MSSISYIIAFFLGGLVGYTFFYFRYEKRDIINMLRSKVSSLQEEYAVMQQDYEEYFLQNEVLKEKTKELLAKNDDLSKIVSELSRYYYHIKKGAEKVQELSRFLSEPDSKIEPHLQELGVESDVTVGHDPMI